MNRVTALARHAVRFEIGVWRSLFRWVTGRDPGAPEDAERFTYVKSVQVTIWAFIIVSAVEVVVVHLIVPWEAIRIVLLLLGLWGLGWMLGLLAAYTVHDHLVQADGVRLRLGFAVDLTVPWDAIEKIVTKERHRSGIRAVQLDESGDALHLVMGSRTNLDLVLTTPTVVELPQGSATVTTIHFFADQPRALLGRVRQEIRAQ